MEVTTDVDFCAAPSAIAGVLAPSVGSGADSGVDEFMGLLFLVVQ
jgi:hypothetical protein